MASLEEDFYLIIGDMPIKRELLMVSILRILDEVDD